MRTLGATKVPDDPIPAMDPRMVDHPEDSKADYHAEDHQEGDHPEDHQAEDHLGGPQMEDPRPDRREQRYRRASGGRSCTSRARSRC